MKWKWSVDDVGDEQAAGLCLETDVDANDIICWEYNKDDEGDYQPVKSFLVPPDDFGFNFILNDDPSVEQNYFQGLFGSWLCLEEEPELTSDGKYEEATCARVLPSDET